MTQVLDIQSAPGWKTHVQSDGSQVAPGSPDPTNYGFVQGVPGYPAALLLYQDGGAFSVVEAYNKIPVPAGTKQIVFDFRLAIDDPTQLWVMETDSILITGGKKYNHSVQRVMKTNMMQVSNQAGGWVDTGIIAPAFQAGVPMRHTFVYGFDASTGAYGTQSFVIDGQSFIVPFAAEERTAVPTTWASEFIYPQIQCCLIPPTGGRVRVLVEGMSYSFS